MKAGTTGLQALEAYACKLDDFQFGSSKTNFSPADVFSNQVPRTRSPSPVHVHVTTLKDATLLLVSYLPTTMNEPHDRIKEFFATREFRQIWPPSRSGA